MIRVGNCVRQVAERAGTAWKLGCYKGSRLHEMSRLLRYGEGAWQSCTTLVLMT